MAARKLLMVTYHFPPSGAVAAHRMLGLARHLPKFGWETVIVAPPAIPDEPYDPELLELVPSSAKVIQVPYPQSFVARQASRFVGMQVWLPAALRAARKAIHQHRPDVIYTSSPPACVHWLGWALKSMFHLPWVACFRDPWITNRRFARRSLAVRSQAFLERELMHSADAIIANTPRNQDGLRAAYSRYADKIISIPNGFDPEFFPAPPAPRTSETLTILHAGEFYCGRDPRPFLDAVRDLQPRYKLEFLGRSTEGLFDLPAEVRARGLTDVTKLGGQVPYRQALAEMCKADVLLLVHSPGYHVGVPAKLYEYLGAGKPILALAEKDSDIAWVLKTSGVPHRIVLPDDVGGIKRALVELAQPALSTEYSVLSTQYSVPGTESGRLQFTRERMAASLAGVLDACLAAAPARRSLLKCAGNS